MLSRETIAAEIERVRRRYLSLLETEREAPSTWELHGDAICWYVVLLDAFEPDIDVEVLEDVVIVRAPADGDAIRHCVLPIPASYRPDARSFRLRAGTLEVRLTLRSG
jgi:hypothetical protein